MIDLARHLVGELERVAATTATWIAERPVATTSRAFEAVRGETATAPVEVDDSAYFLGRFAGGAIGTFELSRCAHGRKNHLTLEIHGSRGSIVYDYERANEVQLCLDDDAEIAGFRRVLIGPAGRRRAARLSRDRRGVRGEHSVPGARSARRRRRRAAHGAGLLRRLARPRGGRGRARRRGPRLDARSHLHRRGRHDVRLLIPFPAGGSTEFTALTLAGPMSQLLGEPVVVEARVGEAGPPGAARAGARDRAHPDGRQRQHQLHRARVVRGADRLRPRRRRAAGGPTSSSTRASRSRAARSPRRRSPRSSPTRGGTGAGSATAPTGSAATRTSTALDWAAPRASRW